MNIDLAIAAMDFSEATRDSTQYSLAMYWAGRKNKFPEELVPVFHWLTMIYVPAELRQGYADFSNGDVQFPDTGHRLLAMQICDQLVAHQHRVSSGTGKPGAGAAPVRDFLSAIKRCVRKV